MIITCLIFCGYKSAANLFAQQQLQLRKEPAKAARQPWNDLVHKVIENETQITEDGDNDIDEDDNHLMIDYYLLLVKHKIPKLLEIIINYIISIY